MQLTAILTFLLLTVPLIGQQETSRSANFYSLEKEAALGNSYAEDFRRQTPSVDDATLRAYVSNVAARLNEFAHSPFPLIIEISGGADSKLEAVGLPGGHLFVSLRLLAGASCGDFRDWIGKFHAYLSRPKHIE